MKKSPLELLKIADSFADIIAHYEERLEAATNPEEAESYFEILELHLSEYESLLKEAESEVAEMIPLYQ